jgi:hypothetical protein
MPEIKDMVGLRFGKLVVLEKADKPKGSKSKSQFWLCQCDCGNKKIISGGSLRNGSTKSCAAPEDITGRRFGKLVAIEFDHKEKKIHYWKCICDCGNEKIANKNHLKTGRTWHCGCTDNRFRKEYGEAGFNALYASYRCNARNRNLNFNLTKDDFKILVESKCYYCDEVPKQIKKGNRLYGNFIYNGIDRINNNIGYEINNVVPCCGICNQAKSNLDFDYFVKWISKVYNNLNKIN